MTIRHHPSDETILAYANGSLATTLSLVVAAHLDGCGKCRATFGLAEAIGGFFLEVAPPVEMNADAMSRVLDRLETPLAKPTTATRVGPDPALALPPALQRQRIATQRWLAPGIWVRPILRDRTDDTRTYLLGAGAGKALPHHSHQGVELTQVLQGEFFDGDVRYGPGDFLEVEGAHAHRPVVGANQECVCVIASQGVPRGFAGLVMRLVS
jgi:putative transcriptional regulator